MESKRKIEIENTLIACMGTMPFSKITVSELCRQGSVSRRVFYYHYVNMDACLNSLIFRTLSDGAVFLSIHTAQSMPAEHKYSVFLEYWIGKADFLKAISDSGCFRIFHVTAVDYILAEDKQLVQLLNRQGIHNAEDVLRFYIGGICDLLMRWAQTDFALPREEMVTVLMRLVHQSL